MRFGWHSGPDCSRLSLPRATGAVPHPAPRVVPVGLPRGWSEDKISRLWRGWMLCFEHWGASSCSFLLHGTPWVFHPRQTDRMRSYLETAKSRTRPLCEGITSISASLLHLLPLVPKPRLAPLLGPLGNGQGNLPGSPLLPPIRRSPVVLETGGEALVCAHEAPVLPSGLRAGSQNQIFLSPPPPSFFPRVYHWLLSLSNKALSSEVL